MDLFKKIGAPNLRKKKYTNGAPSVVDHFIFSGTSFIGFITNSRLR